MAEYIAKEILEEFIERLGVTAQQAEMVSAEAALAYRGVKETLEIMVPIWSKEV